MASSNKVFVSPGVYTSEKDLSFVTRNVGVTTLGLVGETVKGPAFQPIFVSNYDEFKNFFGGLNTKKVKGTGYPMYELPYIAKSYLSESNQLFVTRVLGLSGYDAGCAWGITLDAAVDLETRVSGATRSYDGTTGNELITFTITTGGTLDDSSVVINSNESELIQLESDGVIDFSFLADMDTVGDVNQLELAFTKVVSTDCDYIGASADLEVYSITTGITGTSVVIMGDVTPYTASCYADVDNTVIALLRSRGSYAGDDFRFDLCNSASTLSISTSATTALNDPLGSFELVGTTDSGDPSASFIYDVSFNNKSKNYLPRVLGRSVDDGTTALFVEELYGSMFEKLNNEGKIRGINLSLVDYGDSFSDYKEEYQPAVTPYVVSELMGGVGGSVHKLFRLWTISDGNSANREFKVSISNIKLDDRLFDVEIRAFNDTDKNKIILERFVKCSMNPASDRFIGRRIGTLDGEYASRSNYVLVELDEDADTSDSFPAGFMGYPTRDYSNGTPSGALAPNLIYNTEYTPIEKKRKVYLGISDKTGYDQNIFNYKGAIVNNAPSGMTDGFHMDVNAYDAKINNVNFKFQTGVLPFENESGLVGTDYEKSYARKFTFAPYGGFDGWDVYRTRRTNEDKYKFGGLSAGVVNSRTTSNGEPGNFYDYYAYFEAIRTFSNPEATNINVFATPGIDMLNNPSLIYETIEMVETERSDSLYIATLPDVYEGVTLTAEEIVDEITDEFDSNYTATYWPWVQVNDTENNQLIWLPPTRDVARNIALTDNIAFPWFAVAGIQRGDVNAIKARINLTLEERDTLYEGRINPVASFASDGVKIWGNKTLQENDTALNRINVRRLLLQARKLISSVSIRLLFEQNDEVVRNQFLSLVNPILDNIRSERGLTDFRVVLDNDPEAIDRNELCGKIYIKPTRALEFICVEFNVMNTGASFDDV